MDLSTCQKCNTGKLIPLSDYGPKGVSEVFKAWVCTNPECGFFIRARRMYDLWAGLPKRHQGEMSRVPRGVSESNLWFTERHLAHVLRPEQAHKATPADSTVRKFDTRAKFR